MLYKPIVFWVCIQASIFFLGFFLQKDNIDLHRLNNLQYSVFISRGAGLCLTVTPSLMLLPMCRHTVSFLRKKLKFVDNFLPDFSTYFHKITAYTILFWVLVHMSSHFLNFYGVEHILHLNSVFNLHYTLFSGITGHIMVICLFFIFSFSGIYFRKHYHNLFWYSHHFFIVLFLVFPLHGLGCFVKTDSGACLPYYSYILFSPIVLVYFIERLCREFKSLTKITDVCWYSDGVYKIRFNRIEGNYKPGQYVLINCPELSHFQWHAFTISNSPHEDYTELTLRSLGDWTDSFLSLIQANVLDLPNIKIDGPFGSPIDTICDYDSVILVASGIGITPYISMLKYLTSRCDDSHLKLKQIDLIWVNRSLESFEWFNKELEEIHSSLCCIKINLHMHLTEHITDIEKIREITNGTIPHLNYIDKTSVPIVYGRPDIDTYFNKYSKSTTNLSVGCFVCSSKNVSKIVKSSCNKYSNKDVKFIFKSESFY